MILLLHLLEGGELARYLTGMAGSMPRRPTGGGDNICRGRGFVK